MNKPYKIGDRFWVDESELEITPAEQNGKAPELPKRPMRLKPRKDKQ